MIKLLIGLFCIGSALLLFASACRTEAADYMKRSVLDSRRIDIHEGKTGAVKGYLKQDPLDSRRVLIYGKEGRVKGYLKPNPLDSRKIDIVEVPTNQQPNKEKGVTPWRKKEVD